MDDTGVEIMDRPRHSPMSGEEFLRREDSLRKSMSRMGIRQDNVFFPMSFLSLPVIPTLRLTTRGLFNVEKERYIEANE